MQTEKNDRKEGKKNVAMNESEYRLSVLSVCIIYAVGGFTISNFLNGIFTFTVTE